MDQNPLALSKIDAGDETVIGGQEGDRHCRRTVDGELRRNGSDVINIDDNVRAERAAAQPDDLIANTHKLNGGPHANHTPGEFQAKRRSSKAVLEHLIGKDGQRPHHVAKIQSGRQDFHFHFVRI